MMNQDSLSVKNNSETIQRVLFAALSGFVAGTIAALVSSFINTWLFPDLPLRLEWSLIFFAWVLWAVLGGALAGMAAFSSEGWRSVLLSGLCMAFSALVITIIQSRESALINVILLVGLLLPFSAMFVPLAFLFFWLARRFVRAKSLKGWPRFMIFLVNSIVIFMIGAIPGLYAKMNASTEQGVRVILEILQDAAQASSLNEVHNALLNAEGFAEHRHQPYTLTHAPSASSTVGVDVTAHYDDGYAILCIVILYPGASPSISSCTGQMP